MTFAPGPWLIPSQLLFGGPVMRSTWLPCLCLFALLAPATPSRAGDADKDPIIIVRVRSLDTVEDGLRRLSRWAGDDLMKSWLGSKDIKSIKDLKGCDTKRPLGLYLVGGKIGDKDFQIDAPWCVLVIPVSDRKQFLE